MRAPATTEIDRLGQPQAVEHFRPLRRARRPIESSAILLDRRHRDRLEDLAEDAIGAGRVLLKDSKKQPTNMVPATLEAQIRFDSWTTPGPLVPVRRLNSAMIWTLQISSARLYDGRFRPLDILIDEPRTYAADEVRTVLLGQVTHLEAMVREADREPSTVPPAVRAQWQQAIERLRDAADQIGGANTRDRASLLERHFAVPGTWWISDRLRAETVAWMNKPKQMPAVVATPARRRA